MGDLDDSSHPRQSGGHPGDDQLPGTVAARNGHLAAAQQETAMDMIDGLSQLDRKQVAVQNAVSGQDTGTPTSAVLETELLSASTTELTPEEQANAQVPQPRQQRESGATGWTAGTEPVAQPDHFAQESQDSASEQNQTTAITDDSLAKFSAHKAVNGVESNVTGGQSNQKAGHVHTSAVSVNHTGHSIPESTVKLNGNGTNERNSRANGNRVAPDQKSPIDSVPQITRFMSSGDLLKQSKVTDWKRSRHEVDRAVRITSSLAACFGVCGAVCAVSANELIMYDVDPQSYAINMFKTFDSILSMMTVACLVYLYLLNALISRLDDHVTKGRKFDPTLRLSHVYKNQFMWLEVVVCAIHLPPFCTFEYSSEIRGNFHLQRAETIFAVWSSLRFYLLLRLIKLKVLDYYPKRKAISLYAKVDIGWLFALKKLLHGFRSIVTIAASWLLILIISGYWYRCAEVTACQFKSAIHPNCKTESAQQWTLDGLHYFHKKNDLHMSNAVWAMFVTSTTVGYGDFVPTSHAGRSIASVLAVCGLIFAALLTAALTNAIQFDPTELSALLLLEREKARISLKCQAADLIVAWWRRRTGKHVEMHAMRSEFHHTKRKVHTEVDDAASDAVKLDRTLTNVKYTNEALEHIRAKVLELQSEVSLNKFAPGTPKVEQGGPDSRDKVNDSSKKHKSAFMTRLHSRCQSQKRMPSGWTNSPMKNDAGDIVRQSSKASTGIDKTISVNDRTISSGSGSRYFTIIKQSSDWKHNRKLLSQAAQRNSIASATVAMFGMLCAVAQNEIIIRDGSPSSAAVNLLKALNTLATILLICLLLRGYWLDLLIHRFHGHVKKNIPLNTPVTFGRVMNSKWLWVEIIICSLHLPPFCTFEMSANAFGNFLLYRGETIFTFLNTIRLYLLWRVFRDWVLSDLPSTQSISVISEVHLGSKFAFKRVLNGPYAGAYIAGFWAFMTVLLGYWFRSAELQACFFASAEHVGCQDSTARYWRLYGDQVFEKNNDVYVHNSMWFIFITATSVGYGDVTPTTHFGRATAGAICVLGIVNASILTASLANALMYSSDEVRVMILLEREKARLKLADAAASVLGFWWRTRKKDEGAVHGILGHLHLQYLPTRKELWNTFQDAKRRVKVGVEECIDLNQKITKVWKQSRTVESAVDRIGQDLWMPHFEADLL